MEDLLLKFAKLGSFIHAKATFWLSCDEIDVLEIHGWLRSPCADFYHLSPKAAKYIVPLTMHSDSTKLASYRTAGATDLSKLSLIELIGHLHDESWAENVLSASALKSQQPYKHGSEKLWFSVEGRAPSRSYLLCLCQADKVLTTATAIHHGQLESCLG